MDDLLTAAKAVQWDKIILPARTCRFDLLPGGCRFADDVCKFNHVGRLKLGYSLLGSTHTLPRKPSDDKLREIDNTARRCARICGRDCSQLALQTATRTEVAHSFFLDDDPDHDVFRFAMALHGVTYMGITILDERAAPVEAEAEAEVPPTAEGGESEGVLPEGALEVIEVA